eukprot:scaffold32401_cov53-Phaeocystis_antarctica.AAC.1
MRASVRARRVHIELGQADNMNPWAGNASSVDDPGAHGVKPPAVSAAVEQRVRGAAAPQPPPVGARVRYIHRLVPLHCRPRDADHGIAALLPQLARPRLRAFELGPVQLEENLVVAVRVAAHPLELVEDRVLRRARVERVDRPFGTFAQPAAAADGLAGEEHAADRNRGRILTCRWRQRRWGRSGWRRANDTHVVFAKFLAVAIEL